MSISNPNLIYSRNLKIRNNIDNSNNIKKKSNKKTDTNIPVITDEKFNQASYTKKNNKVLSVNNFIQNKTNNNSNSNINLEESIIEPVCKYNGLDNYACNSIKDDNEVNINIKNNTNSIDFKNKYYNLNNQVSSIKDKLKKEINIKNNNLEAANIKINKLEKVILEKNNKILNLSNNNTALDKINITEISNQNLKLFEENKYLTNKMLNIENNLKKLETENNELLKNTTKLNSDILCLKKNLLIKENEVEILENKLINAISSEESKDIKLKEITNKINNQEECKKLSSTKDEYKFIDYEKDLKNQFSKEISSYKTNYEDIIKKLKQHFDKEKEVLITQVSYLEKDKTDLQKEIEDIKSKIINKLIEEKDTQISDLKIKNNELINYNSSLNIEITRLNGYMDKYVKDIVEKDQIIFKKEEDTFNKTNQYNEKIMLLNKQINDFKLRINEFENEYKTFERIVDDLSNKELKEFVLENNNVCNKKNILSNTIKYLNKLIIEIDKMKIETQILKENNSSIKDKLEYYENEKNDLTYKDLINKIESLQKEKLKISTEFECLKDENSDLNLQNNELKKDLEKLLLIKDKAKNIENLLSEKDKFELTMSNNIFKNNKINSLNNNLQNVVTNTYENTTYCCNLDWTKKIINKANKLKQLSKN